MSGRSGTQNRCSIFADGQDMISIADHLLNWPACYLEGRYAVFELVALAVVMGHWSHISCDVEAPPIRCKGADCVGWQLIEFVPLDCAARVLDRGHSWAFSPCAIMADEEGGYRCRCAVSSVVVCVAVVRDWAEVAIKPVPLE